MKLPNHVSIIMDGNGRWAKLHGRERSYGHQVGVESVRAIIEECLELGIPYLSLFAFSEENWGRPTEEVDGLMSLLGKAVFDELDNLVNRGVRFIALGNRERLGTDLNDGLKVLEEHTAANTKMTLVVFLSYSGQWDIQQAANRMAAAGDDKLEPYLVTAGIPNPDLLIRTSGEKRVSNFMLWQIAYSEFVVVDTLWPDFRKDSFRAALEEFASRDRRYGKVKQ